MAVALYRSNAVSVVSVLIGNGDGTFVAPPMMFGAGRAPASVAVGDFNGDGVKDLAVANYASNTVSIRLGNGRRGTVGILQTGEFGSFAIEARSAANSGKRAARAGANRPGRKPCLISPAGP